MSFSFYHEEFKNQPLVQNQHLIYEHSSSSDEDVTSLLTVQKKNIHEVKTNKKQKQNLSEHKLD